jgi:hypothetical protein
MNRGKTDSAAENDEWPAITETLIGGLDRNLCRSAAKRLHLELEAFRARSMTVRGKAARRQFERELDTYVENSASLRAAARRDIRERMQNVVLSLESAVAAMEKWKSATIQHPTMRRQK